MKADSILLTDTGEMGFEKILGLKEVQHKKKTDRGVFFKVSGF